jgi:hypothetical protein
MEGRGLFSPSLKVRREMLTHPMGSLLVSGVQEFHMEDVFTHQWRVYWYQETRSFISKMRLLIHGEFTGIKSPGVSYERCVYSFMESLLVSGVQEFL